MTELLPALLVFSLGLAATVAPLTATVLADADEEHAGIASGVNNAIARAAGLLGVAALGAVIAAQFTGTLDDRLAGTTLSPRGQAAVARGRRRARSARADVSGLPIAEAVEIAAATEAAAVSRVPLRHGDQRRARRPRRPSSGCARAQPAPRGQLRRLPRGPARGRPGRRRARAPGRRARVSDHASSDSACARVAAIVSSPRVVRRSSVGSIASPGTTTSRAPRRVRSGRSAAASPRARRARSARRATDRAGPGTSRR